MKMTDFWPIKPLAHQAAVIRGEAYRITVLTNRLLRLEYDPQGRFCDTATQAVLNRAFDVPAFTVQDTESLITVETDCLRLEYDKRPFTGTGLMVTLKSALAFYASIWHYGDEPDTLGGTARTLDEADGAIPLEPGLMSHKGYAVLDDSASMGMDESGRLLPAKDHGIDLYLFAYGHDFAGCLRDFLTLSGRVPPVPRLALGNWWSRFYPYTQESYMALMKRFAQEGVPLSVSVLDMNWHVTAIDPKYGPGWTGYTWDREKFPEPQKLLAWLHEQGLAVTLNDHPADGVRGCEEMYPAMARRMGDDPAREKPYPYDAADEKFQQAFEECVLEPFEAMGVDFWWIDWQQQGGTTDPGLDPLFVLNHTRYIHAMEHGKPAMILSRYGGPGSHRYPLGFSGDTIATWASLAFQPRFTATAANIGYTWWSHDIGGHMHGVKSDEMALRWLQFGVFSPVMRLHSSTNRFMRKEPWLYPVGIAEVMKRYLRLRHQLVPWLYSQNVRSSRERQALLRPLYYDFPEDRRFYFKGQNQYLLGDSLMVCPITQPAEEQSKLAGVAVELPDGEWIDFFTGLRYEGGGSMTMYRDKENIPVLVRAGAILPMDAAEIPVNGAALPETVLLRVFPGADGETALVEDNGLLPSDPDYRQAITRVRLSSGEKLRVELFPVEGEAALLPENRRYVVEICGMADVLPDSANCGVKAGYHDKERTLRLELNAAPHQGAVLTWDRHPSLPEFNWQERLESLLMPAELPYDQKDAVMHMAQNNGSRLRLLAGVHPLGLPQPLYGALLELMTAY